MVKGCFYSAAQNKAFGHKARGYCVGIVGVLLCYCAIVLGLLVVTNGGANSDKVATMLVTESTQDLDGLW